MGNIVYWAGTRFYDLVSDDCNNKKHLSCCVDLMHNPHWTCTCVTSEHWSIYIIFQIYKIHKGNSISALVKWPSTWSKKYYNKPQSKYDIIMCTVYSNKEFYQFRNKNTSDMHFYSYCGDCMIKFFLLLLNEYNHISPVKL